MKQIVIIPGSCADQSNWFDQIVYFESLGYNVKFLDLEAVRAKSFTQCAMNLFDNCKYAFNAVDNDATRVIYCHSMGAMLLLKILLEPKFYQNQNAELYDKIRRSKIVFLQMPLSVNKFLLYLVEFLRFPLYPLFFFYHWIFFRPVAFILLTLKSLLFRFKTAFDPSFITDVFDFMLNNFLMSNSFWGTKAGEFFNVVNYYRQYRDFISGLFVDGSLTRFQKEMNKIADDKLSDLDKSNAANYFFTAGDPDWFCSEKLTQNFAQRLGAQYLLLPFNLHNPHHVFWYQNRVNEIALSETSVNPLLNNHNQHEQPHQ